MFKRRLIAADQASIFMAMTIEQRSSTLVLHQMTSDHNRSELGIHDHNNEPSSLKLVLTVVPLALSCLLKEQLLEPALNLIVHCCGLEFRVLNGYDQKSFDEERGLNCVVQTSL
ncbi:hypothetical protein Tco_0504979 [Tanacetum coccineum]